MHERCVHNAKNTCIHTYNAKKDSKMYHHWLNSNNAAKCAKCKKTVLIFQGKVCRWCKYIVNLY